MPKWGSFGLILFGEKSSGKSHLLKIFCEEIEDCNLINSEEIDINNVEEIVFKNKVIVIDNADKIKDEQALFHIFNLAKEERKNLVLSGSKELKFWWLKLKDLSSRLGTFTAIKINPPDEITLNQVMIKMFTDRQIKIEEGVLRYVLPRIERSYSAAREFVEKADKISLKEKKGITLSIAREVLEKNI
jgi:chromosomal replication initiation ATPase DnaA